MKTFAITAAITAALSAALSVALGLLAPATAAAQEINLGTLDQEAHRVHVTTGFEYGLVAGVGYSQAVRFLDRHVVLAGEATVPWAPVELSDFELRATALAPLIGSPRWKLAASLSPVVRGTQNRIDRMVDVGLDVALIGGFYSRAWFVALEGGTDLALATHVTHSDAYRDNVFPDARDGWYRSPGANFYGGVQAGVSVSRYDVSLRAGQIRDLGGNAPMMPLYATLTAAARW